ncbi:hypothetical protein N752_17245 [Desulforamulus aquiferis]|nr:hypothetical protein N752_17245 [Desulforamulus aquiferis]
MERRYKGVRVTFLNVPAEVCTSCGEELIDEYIVDKMDYILQNIELDKDYMIIDFIKFNDLLQSKDEISVTKELQVCFA